MNRKLLFGIVGGTCLLASCAGAPQQSTPAASASPTASSPAPGAPEKPAQKATTRGNAPAAAQERAGSRSSSPAGTGSSATSGGKAAPSGASSERPTEVSQEERRSAREHVIEAMKLLDKGDPGAARPELTSALRQEPGNETAASLLKQLDANPEEMLGQEHFTYTVQGGDTLSKIAKKFLNDENKFYILARYNGLQVPGDLSAGQALKIPGKKPAPPAKPAPQPVKESAPPAAKPTPAPRESPAAPAKPPAKETSPAKASERESGPEKLYQSGLQALKGGAPDRAYELFSQVLRANPKHAAAQEKMREVRGAAVEALYKKAVAAYRRQDLDETIRLCNRALEIDPENEKVKLRRAEAMELQEKMKSFK